MATEKKAGAPTEGLPEVDILMRGLMSQPGVEGFMVFNESGKPYDYAAYTINYVFICVPVQASRSSGRQALYGQD
jgi:hypothetical protein